ncbi:hypothetical protein DFH09DRAFT_1375090 [Mycena vulgaris]|nr:hypothetical protein DFH09DRAFT_1375090 [Mycena vulgaris]
MVRAHHVSLRWLVLIPSFLLFLSPSLTVAALVCAGSTCIHTPASPRKSVQAIPWALKFSKLPFQHCPECPRARCLKSLKCRRSSAKAASTSSNHLQSIQSRCSLRHGQQNSKNLARGNTSQAPTPYGRRRLLSFAKTQAWHDTPRRPEARSHKSATADRCIDAWVPVTLIDAAAAEFTLDASNHDPGNPMLQVSIFSSAPARGRGAALLDVLFSIALPCS